MTVLQSILDFFLSFGGDFVIAVENCGEVGIKIVEIFKRANLRL
jgi:phosphopantetheinyl transferase